MKIKFLVQGKNNLNDRYDIICQGNYLKNLTVCAETFDEGVEAMQFVLEQLMKYKGSKWINKWKGFSGCVNCPEAYIELPSDIWKCKITGDSCSIQAQISIKDKAGFLARCCASQDRKENIYRIIQEKKYSGFHHIPGRFLCVQCEVDKGKQINKKYHYPWELVSISDCLDFSGIFKSEKTESGKILNHGDSLAFEKQLKDQGYLTIEEMLTQEGFTPLSASFGICPVCCDRILSIIFPEIKELIHVIEINYFQR